MEPSCLSEFSEQSLALLREVIGRNNEAALLLNSEGRVMTLTPAAEQIIGVSQGTAQGKLLDELVEIYSQDPSQQRLLFPAKTVLQQFTKLNNFNHAYLVSKEGKNIPIALSLSPIYNQNLLGGALLILSELGGSQPTVRSQPDNDEIYRSLFHTLPYGVLIAKWMRDDQGQPFDLSILQVNPRFEELCGWKADELKSKSGSQIFGADFPALLDDLLKLDESTQSIQFEIDVSSWERHLEITAFALGSDPLMIVFQDISSQKQIQRSLERGAQFFQNFFQTSTDAIIVVDLSGKILLWNAAAERIFGYSAEEALGRTVDDLIIPQQKQDWVDQEWKKMVENAQGKTQTVTLEFECCTKSGSQVPVEVSLWLTTVENEWIGTASVRDISDRKHIQEAIQRRDAILTAVNYIAEHLLQADDWKDVIHEILATLGIATEVDRVYIFKKDDQQIDDDIRMSQIFEWTADGIPPQIDNPDLQALPLRQSGFGRWLEMLSQGKALYGLIAEFPESEQALLSVQDILSLAVVPISIEDQWWGFIGFDDCHTPRPWSQPEIDALRAAASIIGTAIHRQEMSRQIQHSERRYQNLVEQLPVVVYVAVANDRGELQAEYISPNVQDLCGYAPSEIYNDPYLWIQRIHAEDRSQAIQIYFQHIRAITAWDQEYRLVRKSGEVIWVREQAIPILDPETQIVRAQGIIQDISLERRRQREQQAIQLVHQALQADLDLDSLLNRLLEAVIHAVPNAEKGSILLVNGADRLSFRALYGYQDQRIWQIDFPISSGYSAKAFRERRPLIISDARSDLSIRYEGELEEMAAIQSAIVAPLLLHDQAIGVISIDNASQTNAFTQEDLHFLSQIASTAALVVENIRLLENARQRLEELKVLSDLSFSLRTAETHHEMIEAVLDQLLAGLEVHCAAIRLIDTQSKQIVHEASRGFWKNLEQVIQALGEEKFLTLLENKKPILLNQTDCDPSPNVCHCQSFAAVALVAKETTIGVLIVGRIGKISEQDIHLLEAIGDIAANALYRASLYEITEKQLRYLSSLYTIDRAISSRHDLQSILKIIAQEAKTQLGIDALGIYLYEPYSNLLKYMAGDGFRTLLIQNTVLPVGEGVIGQAAKERIPIYIANIFTLNDPLAKSKLCLEEGFVSHHIAPLLIQDQLKGVLEVFHRQPFDPPQDWRALFEAFADQAAIAIDNAQLFEDIQRSNLQISIAYDATIEGWAKALEQRDRETLGHSNRVTELTLHLAAEMGIPSDQMIHIWRGVRLHDIGKMAIPDSVLLKPGPLSDLEWEIMRRHPLYAYELLSPIEYLRPALDIPYCHHENWDGSGYPRGLKGEEIPLAARIFTVVDVWDALTSDRPYRPAWTPEKALEYICEQRGKKFDPKIVDLFLRIIEEIRSRESNQ